MIGLDTNILVRLLVRDDPAQTEKARHFIDTHCTPESPGYINCIVLAELVWVLDSVYRFGRAEIAAAVEGVLAGRDRVVEYRDEVQEALTAYKTSGIDFADILIGRVNLARGCSGTATFDRKAAKLEGFVRVS